MRISELRPILGPADGLENQAVEWSKSGALLRVGP